MVMVTVMVHGQYQYSIIYWKIRIRRLIGDKIQNTYQFLRYFLCNHIVRSFEILIPLVDSKSRLSQLIQKEESSIADSFGFS